MPQLDGGKAVTKGLWAFSCCLLAVSALTQRDRPCTQHISHPPWGSMHNRVIFSNPEDLKRKAAGRTGEHGGSTCVKASPALSSPSSYSIMYTAWAQQTVSYPGNAWPQLKGFLQFRQQIKHTCLFTVLIFLAETEKGMLTSYSSILHKDATAPS